MISREMLESEGIHSYVVDCDICVDAQDVERCNAILREARVPYVCVWYGVPGTTIGDYVIERMHW